MDKPIHVFSEIGKLKTVLLKRPGQEVEEFDTRYYGSSVVR